MFTALWGKVYDKKGFRFSGLWAAGLLFFGLVTLGASRSTAPVFLGSLLMMCGYLAGMAVFGAAIREHTPRGMAGRFQGVRIFCQVLLPGVIGPFIGSTVLSGAEKRLNDDGTLSFIPHAGIFWAAAAVTLLLLPFLLRKEKRETVPLYTPYEKNGRGSFDEYPRPAFKRDSYLCLNGAWDFSVESKRGRERLGRIRVPFPPESRLSGIKRRIREDETMVYRRRFCVPEGFCKKRVLLHFGAVDQIAEVFLNKTRLGEHRGGYLPFSFDVTDSLLAGENEITVRARDPLSHDLPWGKQTKEPGGMWYTPVSGIWQTVWMESIPESAIEKIQTESGLDRVTLHVSGGEEKKTLILYGNGRAEEFHFTGDSLTLSFPEGHLWTPEDPHLYRYTLISGKDRIESYFALRTVSIGERGGVPLILLNEKPYYFHGLLDQGYFPDGIFLPATAEGYRRDILEMKRLGFNTLRKHIKVEPQIFYYECDRLGMLVFQDMVNTGDYSFLRDTALPTLGIRRGIRHKVSQEAKKSFLETAEGILDLLSVHPCVVYYTLFNEGWGQFDADEVFARLKKREPRRILDATSGWFRETESDVESEHVYFKPLRFKEGAKRPLVLSEFGGYSFRVKGHIFNQRDNYGYRSFSSEKDFRRALCELYDNEVIPAMEKGLCATVLTQVSDVEDETNGMFTYDRQALKVDPDEMQQLAVRCKARFHALFGEK
ncbi:MAG: glycoside hydrolase family 2 [Clostridia bacterium]|nr:glycoside hydrolase family 2 [Clostridia bacterium]